MRKRELMNLTSTELLQTIEERGARVSVAPGANGAMKLRIAPNGLISDLVDDIREHARELRELLQSQPPARRWSEPSPPNLGELAVIVEAATVGVHLKPTPDLMRAWRGLSAYCGVSLTSRHIGAAARLATERPELSPDDLIEMFVAGLLPDDGGPVWRLPDELVAETHAMARLRAPPRCPNL